MQTLAELYEYYEPIFTIFFGKTIGAPIENAQLILQLQNLRTPYVIQPKFTFFASLLGNLRHGVNFSNFLSLFSGNFLNIVRYFLMLVVDAYLGSRLYRLGQSNTYLTLLLSALRTTGGISMILVYPLDLLRYRVVLDAISVNRKYSRLPVVSAIQCLKDVLTNEGLLRPFAGLWISALGNVVSLASQYSLYIVFGKMMPRSSVGVSVFKWFVTFAATFMTYPFDTVRKCMMVSGCSSSQAVQQIYNTGGVPAFFNGIVMGILRSILITLLFQIIEYLIEKMQKPQQPPVNPLYRWQITEEEEL